jgi:hypothetical protein
MPNPWDVLYGKVARGEGWARLDLTDQCIKLTKLNLIYVYMPNYEQTIH